MTARTSLSVNQNAGSGIPNSFGSVGFSSNRVHSSFQPIFNGKPCMTQEEYDGKRLRKTSMRKTVDYNSSIMRYIQDRVWHGHGYDKPALQPDVLFYPELHPPQGYMENPINSVCTRFVRTATNKMRCPIFCLSWTPDGRRLITGASSGEFTLWNGLTFNFETILQAHDGPVRAMIWSHSDQWMVTGDHGGYVKYWQVNMNNVKMFQAHKDPIRGICFSPSDMKIATCSDDGTLRLWDFDRCQEERVLRGHGSDVKTCDWHPFKGLVVSGSKDTQQPIRFWDPRSGTCLATLHSHKAAVVDMKFNSNGNWLLTASRDHLLKLFDIRHLSKELQVFRGHKKEASCVSWHPIHERLVVSGGSDGCIMYWTVGQDSEVGSIEQSHDSLIWALAWHPLGHVLASGSNDHTSKFWTRSRPGDTLQDKYCSSSASGGGGGGASSLTLNHSAGGAAGNSDVTKHDTTSSAKFGLGFNRPSGILPGTSVNIEADYSGLYLPGSDDGSDDADDAVMALDSARDEVTQQTRPRAEVRSHGARWQEGAGGSGSRLRQRQSQDSGDRRRSGHTEQRSRRTAASGGGGGGRVSFEGHWNETWRGGSPGATPGGDRRWGNHSSAPDRSERSDFRSNNMYPSERRGSPNSRRLGLLDTPGPPLMSGAEERRYHPSSDHHRRYGPAAMLMDDYDIGCSLDERQENAPRSEGHQGHHYDPRLEYGAEQYTEGAHHAMGGAYDSAAQFVDYDEEYQRDDTLRGDDGHYPPLVAPFPPPLVSHGPMRVRGAARFNFKRDHQMEPDEAGVDGRGLVAAKGMRMPHRGHDKGRGMMRSPYRMSRTGRRPLRPRQPNMPPPRGANARDFY